MVASSVGSSVVDTVNMVFVNAPAGLGASQREKLRNYTEVRLGKKNIHLVMNPSDFPWPKPEAPKAGAKGEADDAGRPVKGKK